MFGECSSGSRGISREMKPIQNTAQKSARIIIPLGPDRGRTVLRRFPFTRKIQSNALTSFGDLVGQNPVTRSDTFRLDRASLWKFVRSKPDRRKNGCGWI
jgi:hypothetical protein